MSPDELYTISQAAEVCSVSRATIWRWIKMGKIRAAVTLGKHHRIAKKDLLEFIEQNEMSPRFREPARKDRVLIVDDDGGIRKLLVKILETKGYTVAVAVDGFEAGQQVIKFQPHLVVLDLFMPKTHGFEVCRRLKENPDTKNIKILAISGYNTAENAKRVLEIGADAFLPKPIDNKVFRKEVSKLLPLPRAQRR